MSGGRDDLVARAKVAAGGGVHDDGGERIETLGDSGDVFVGQYRGEAEDENDNYHCHGRRVHLAWDEDDQACCVRGKWSLNYEFDRMHPEVGDTIAIVVGEARERKSGVSDFNYGLEAQPNNAPLPEQPADDNVGIPF